jgi:hypothetical protein
MMAFYLRSGLANGCASAGADVEAVMKPAGPAIPRRGDGDTPGGSSAAQSFWDGKYIPLAEL